MSRIRTIVVALVVAVAVCAPSSATASAPGAVGAASPASVVRGASVLLTVAVVPGTEPPSTGILVTCNLTAIGGSFSELFADDGTDGDASAGDLVFSHHATVASGTAAGNYSLPCVVSDAQGRIALSAIQLEVKDVGVENLAPTVHAGGPYAADEGSAVGLAATGSDPEGGALSYSWDLNNDGVFETSGQTRSFTAADGPATLTIGVKATDDKGLSDIDRTALVIKNVPPTAIFVFPSAVEAGAEFAISMANPADPSKADSDAGFTYAFDCGAGYGQFTSSAAASCTKNEVGPLQVGAQIQDKDGGVTEHRATVDVSVSAEGLCTLTRRLAKRDQVADALCVKLAHGAFGAYANQVDGQAGAQPGKAFTDADGALLTALAAQLVRS